MLDPEAIEQIKAMNVLATHPDAQADMSSAARAVLLTGSAGFLFANLTAHFGAHSGSDFSPVGHAWFTAVYTLASFVGVATAEPLEQRLGMRRYFVSGALLLSVFGFLQVLVPCPPVLLAMRAFEGFASGSFGPKALLAAFLFCRNGRLPTTMALAVFFLLVAGVIGFVMFGASTSGLGQRGLFLVQFGLGLLMALAGLRWLPRLSHATPPLAVPTRDDVTFHFHGETLQCPNGSYISIPASSERIPRAASSLPTSWTVIDNCRQESASSIGTWLPNRFPIYPAPTWPLQAAA